MLAVDRLYASVLKNGPVCVGLDTDISYIPDLEKKSDQTISEILFAFNRSIIDSAIDLAACFKVQIAYYESLGLEGLLAYQKTLAYLRQKNAIIIADIKRGDIAKTAEMYAKAHFTGDFEADWITVNPWMGYDTLEPYLPYLKNSGKGIFVLLSTSNPGAKDLEYQTDPEGTPLWKKLGNHITKIGAQYQGESGYSNIGAVVGCTRPEDATEIRSLYPSMFFLVPGYGAQGGSATEMQSSFDSNQNGAVVNASRSILLAYQKNPSLSVAEAARAEVQSMRKAFLFK